eukprot:m.263904 g.263904  ORF g.263904 m.263904 type:complete len:652 (+) comp27381_c0_seq1:272-2227(+)
MHEEQLRALHAAVIRPAQPDFDVRTADRGFIRRLRAIQLEAAGSSIDDIDQEHLVPLWDALQSASQDSRLTTAIALGLDLRACWETAIAFAEARLAERPRPRLCRDEIAAIYIYTLEEGKFYRVLNDRMRAADRNLLRPFRPFIKLLLVALTKLKPCKGLMFRGISEDVSMHYDSTSNQTRVWDGFSSVSTNMERVKPFLGNAIHQTFFTIEVQHAVNISMYSSVRNEEECILLPRSELEVVATMTTAGITQVHLRQLPYVPLIRLSTDSPQAVCSARRALLAISVLSIVGVVVGVIKPGANANSASTIGDRGCTCPGGTMLANACNGMATPVCVPCPAGSFSASGNHTSCTACTTNCSAGQYLVGSCTSTSTPTCTACEPGWYAASPGSRTACTACTSTCAAGSYLSHDSCTATTTPSCTLCAAGTYSDSSGNQTACTACRAGTYARSAGSITCPNCSDPYCTSCITECPSGSYLDGTCSTTTSTTCTPCTTSCGAGYYLLGTCSTSSNPTCVPCTAACSPGQYLDGACSTVSNPTCLPCNASCPAGTYLRGSCTAHTPTCTPCTASCPGGHYLNGWCSTYSNPTCETCLPGSYSTGGAAESCTTCGTGTYQTTSGATACNTCACPPCDLAVGECTPTTFPKCIRGALCV